MNNGTQNYVLTKKQLYILLVGCGGESVRGLKLTVIFPIRRKSSKLSENCRTEDMLFRTETIFIP